MPPSIPSLSAYTVCREYTKVPNQLKDDNVIPSVSEIPSLLTSLRHPRRSRSVSVGPQSEADAYETLAYREKRRQESRSDMTMANSIIGERGGIPKSSPDYFGVTTSNNASKKYPTAGLLPTPASSNSDLYQSMIGAETAPYTPLTPGNASGSGSRRPSAERRQDEKEERELFSKLEKPRVRYDVEVITKLVVYTGMSTSICTKSRNGLNNAAGIGWIAIDGGPLLFEVLGLGFNGRPP